MSRIKHQHTPPDPLMGAQKRVVICAGTGCVANGAMKVYAAFQEQMREQHLAFILELREEHDNSGKTAITRSGCQGFCQMGPLVTILPDNILYNQVRAEDVAEIIAASLRGHGTVERLLYSEPANGHVCQGTSDIPFYTRQQRFVLADCGLIDPESIEEYQRGGGYEAARKAFLAMSAEEVCTEISESGLRGRGGGGFPTGRKWEAARKQAGEKKYVICNADEGDPGAFMNRSVMEGNPHSVIEGLMIAARAIGADETLVYVRAEYPLAVQRMRRAVASETPASACITWRCRFRRGRSGPCERLLRPGHARQRGRRWIGRWQRASQQVPCCVFWLLPRPLRGLRRGCVGFRIGSQIAKHRLRQRGRPTRRKRQQQRWRGSVRSCS